MKTSFMKQVLPVVVAAFGIAGAFTTHAMSERSKIFTPVQGYIKLSPAGTVCEAFDVCSTINNGIICTVGYVPGGTQLYGKNSAGLCTVTVFMP
jgi:hypothetical protein